MNKTALTSYEMWYDISYSHSKILRMIRMKAVVHKKKIWTKKSEKTFRARQENDLDKI